MGLTAGFPFGWLEPDRYSPVTCETAPGDEADEFGACREGLEGPRTGAAAWLDFHDPSMIDTAGFAKVRRPFPRLAQAGQRDPEAGDGQPGVPPARSGEVRRVPRGFMRRCPGNGWLSRRSTVGVCGARGIAPAANRHGTESAPRPRATCGAEADRHQREDRGAPKRPGPLLSKNPITTVDVLNRCRAVARRVNEARKWNEWPE